MSARSNLPLGKRAQIDPLSEAVFSKCRIDGDLCYNQAAVGDAIRRFRQMGSNKDQPNSERPPCSTPAQDRFIALIA